MRLYAVRLPSRIDQAPDLYYSGPRTIDGSATMLEWSDDAVDATRFTRDQVDTLFTTRADFIGCVAEEIEIVDAVDEDTL